MRNTRPVVAATAMPEEAPELVVDREFRSPRPLDRNISTVSLKTPTNNVTEGYDLQLSATFGKERITLVSRGVRDRGRLLDEQGQHRALVPQLRLCRDQ